MTAENTTTTPLWAVHIEGPDDMRAAPSKDAAEQRAKDINDEYERWRQSLIASPNPPRWHAVVVPWPHDAPGHAEDVASWDRPDWSS